MAAFETGNISSDAVLKCFHRPIIQIIQLVYFCFSRTLRCNPRSSVVVILHIWAVWDTCFVIFGQREHLQESAPERSGSTGSSQLDRDQVSHVVCCQVHPAVELYHVQFRSNPSQMWVLFLCSVELRAPWRRHIETSELCVHVECVRK